MPMEYSSSQRDEHAIDFLEFERLLEQYRSIGKQKNGGITRLAASHEDRQARDALVQWLRDEGAEVRIDAVGNIFGLFRLAEQQAGDAPFVMSGSHLDSQENAGTLDGTYGVIAACVAARALNRYKAQGMRFLADFCVVNWTNEEGARFRPSVLGSSTYAGRCTTAEALAVQDDNGLSLSSALAEIGYLGQDIAPHPPQSYVELHIEQGSRLEDEGRDIGIVTGNWGAIKYELAFIGEQAHTGPCPMPERKDALLAAAHTIVGVRALANPIADDEARVHTSIGRIQVFPNSSNVVPAKAQLSIEIRSADFKALQTRSSQLESLIQTAADQANVDYTVDAKSTRAPAALSTQVAAVVEEAAREVGARTLRMDTISGHDAISLLTQTEVGLIFVPSVQGISHNPKEHTEMPDLRQGVRVLTQSLIRLCATP